MKNFHLILSFFLLCNYLSVFSQETLIDVDGNRYKTVKIGNQIWMAEDLRVSHFRNGEEIPLTRVETSTLIGGECLASPTRGNTKHGGTVYNWFAVVDSRNIAPEGWHVPTIEEWQELIDYLGGTKIAGIKLKEKGSTNWKSPNTGSTNESGFTALPGGYVFFGAACTFTGYGKNVAYFSSTGRGALFAYGINLFWNKEEVQILKTQGKKDACFVRLVKDN